MATKLTKIIFFLAAVTLISKSVDLRAQSSPLDQYVFTSPFDSILLRDYLQPQRNYVVSLYASWCTLCNFNLRKWKDHYSDWQEEYDLTIIVLNDDTNIENGIEELNDYPYDHFTTKLEFSDIGVNAIPTNFFYAFNKEKVFWTRGYTSPIKMEGHFEKYFSKRDPFFLNHQLSEYVDRWVDCSASTSRVTSSNTSITISDKLFSIFKYENSRQPYYLRHSDNGSQILFYNISDKQEYVLFDYSKDVCQMVTLYSPINQQKITTKVIDIYEVNHYKHFELDLPFLDCEDDTQYLTLIEGIGSNAGILPEWNEAGVITELNCQYQENISYPTYENNEGCGAIKSRSTEAYEDFNILTIFPNPAYKELFIEYDIPKNAAIEIVLYNILGEKVSSAIKEIPKGKSIIRLSVQYLANGVYYGVINSDDNRVSFSVQVMR